MESKACFIETERQTKEETLFQRGLSTLPAALHRTDGCGPHRSICSSAVAVVFGSSIGSKPELFWVSCKDLTKGHQEEGHVEGEEEMPERMTEAPLLSGARLPGKGEKTQQRQGVQRGEQRQPGPSHGIPHAIRIAACSCLQLLAVRVAYTRNKRLHTSGQWRSRPQLPLLFLT